MVDPLTDLLEIAKTCMIFVVDRLLVLSFIF